MSDHEVKDLYFEKFARRDLRIWLTFAIGCGFLILIFDTEFGSNFSKGAQGPKWLVTLMFIIGLCMAAFGAICLIFNTSRGCMILYDTEELVWWQMKYANQDVRSKNKIRLRDIESIRIDKFNDGLDVSLYNTSAQKQETFSEAILPPDYETWIASLVEKWPNVQVEIKD